MTIFCMNMLTRRPLSLPALIFALGLIGASPPASAQRTPASDTEVCKNCHADHVESYLATKHGQSGNVRGPDCITCHGQNAVEHAKLGGGRGVGGIFRFADKAVPAEKKAAVCLGCHEGNRHLAFWESGRHKKNDVSCDSCHKIHEPRNVPLRTDNPSISPLVTTTRQLEYETCTSCHKQIRSQLLKTSHHPIIEGKLKCSSCHNPHGALSHAMVKDESINQLCTSCHADKRGPYMQEHPPVEENCLTCHNSHGSPHAKLLNQRVPNLCQDCHDWSRHPGTYYSGNQGFGSPTTGAPNTRLVNRACLNCHTSIHGTNAPANRGKFFTR